MHPAGSHHALEGLAVRGLRMHPSSLPILSTRKALKILVRHRPALPSCAHHNYILFPWEHMLDICQFHFQHPHPHPGIPTHFPVLVPQKVFSLGKQ